MRPGRAADVSGATVDAETGEAGSARPRLRRAGDPAGDRQDSDRRLRRVLAGTARLQRLQRRPVARAGRLQSGRLYAKHRSGLRRIRLSLICQRRRHPSFLPVNPR